MKTNIERLVVALDQSDEGGGWLDERELSVVIDGTYETAALDSAINEHIVPLHSVIRERPAKAMFLREVWATGTTDDGREFEISASGPTLILSIGPFDDSREVYTIDLVHLAPAWLRTVGAGS